MTRPALCFQRAVWLLLLSPVVCAAAGLEQGGPECTAKGVEVVVASLGRSNADGDPEDLSWIVPGVEETKGVHVFQRSHAHQSHYIGTSNGNECLTYVTYIKERYHALPDAVIFVHADAPRHCPLIADVLRLPNEHILGLLEDPARRVRGYIPLSKVFLNQTKKNLEKFKYPLISLSNYILEEKYRFSKLQGSRQQLDGHKCAPLPPDRPASPRLSASEQQKNSDLFESEFRDDVENSFPFVSEYPEFITTYTSGSFIVSKENILSFPLHFYEQLSDDLFAGGRTCGYLEYLWSSLWGAPPFRALPEQQDPLCGPLFHTDITPGSGFLFFASDDGSVEAGRLPDGYHGRVLLR